MVYCKSCGDFNDVTQTLDNAWCSNCGDTENLVWEDSDEWEQLTEDNE